MLLFKKAVAEGPPAEAWIPPIRHDKSLIRIRQTRPELLCQVLSKQGRRKNGKKGMFRPLPDTHLVDRLCRRNKFHAQSMEFIYKNESSFPSQSEIFFQY